MLEPAATSTLHAPATNAPARAIGQAPTINKAGKARPPNALIVAIPPHLPQERAFIA